MSKSIDLATDASRWAALLLGYIQAVCAFVAPCPPGASTAIFDRLSHSRALSNARRDRVGESRESWLKAQIFADAPAVEQRVERLRFFRVCAVGLRCCHRGEERGQVRRF